ncbi:hypothetical protein SKAU_G00211290 [Synaphobranchus kaupii]|uniref:CCHC-type domain-containing protein n=1 Tax=Synaphobranchus kaupii TaxID=118154 RepID=A0A9Q1F950_SYNKA|nr:hypothetical protein SKAU_G00211290 [Synaphobranchus kaupii]
MLRSQALMEEQQTEFMLGALEGRAQREVQVLGEGQGVNVLWKELDDRYGHPTPLPIALNRVFQCRQQPGVPLFDYQLDLCELHSRWREWEPGGEGKDDSLLHDQFLLGLLDGLVKQDLQQQVRRQTSLTFRQVSVEVHALERELWGEEGLASQVPVASLATREPPCRPEVDLGQWKEEVKRKLRQELQDKLAALGKTQVSEQQCAPGPVAQLSGGTEPQGANNNHSYGPLSDQHSFPYRWDEWGRPICRECGEVGHVQQRCPACRQPAGEGAPRVGESIRGLPSPPEPAPRPGAPDEILSRFQPALNNPLGSSARWPRHGVADPSPWCRRCWRAG